MHHEAMDCEYTGCRQCSLQLFGFKAASNFPAARTKGIDFGNKLKGSPFDLGKAIKPAKSMGVRIKKRPVIQSNRVVDYKRGWVSSSFPDFSALT
ncbi:MAG: hypothetical protein WB502_05755 [Thermoactinomyces sp.]